MEQDTAGYVVNVASMVGVVEAIDAYDVSKHAAVALTETQYHELADRAPQIKVSVFLPGPDPGGVEHQYARQDTP
jgi:short-subunit dehydrogenase